MTDERKKELGQRLVELVEEMKQITLEAKAGISLMTTYSMGDNGAFAQTCNFLHYKDRLVHLMPKELENAFLIDRDDSIKKEEDEDEGENTEE